MKISLAALKTLHEELGGPNKLWVGYSSKHEWLLLDRTLASNSPESKTCPLIFERLKDFSEVQITRGEWTAMTDLAYYERLKLEPPVFALVADRLKNWKIRRFARLMQESRRKREATISLLLEELRVRKDVESAGVDSIVKDRNIEFLLHFTSISNLSSILANGLLPRQALDELLMPYRHNDDQRLDGFKEASSLSISFPNSFMLSTKRGQNHDDYFCIVAIDPAVLRELPCLFYPSNAAGRGHSTNTDLEPHIGAKGLLRMFEGGESIRDKYSVPRSFTTNTQAEVLVFTKIATHYFRGVALPRRLTSKDPDLLARKDPDLPVQLVAAGIPELFNTRWFGNRVDFQAHFE